MKTLLLSTFAIAFAGCTMIPTPHGTAQFWGDYTNVNFEDGPVKFHADSMIHSHVVKAHWHGVSNLGAEVVGGMIGLKGGNEALGAAVSIVTPIVNRPTSRATPPPK